MSRGRGLCTKLKDEADAPNSASTSRKALKSRSEGMNRNKVGTFLMNLGSVASLSGFMMTDVFALRALSIFGSLCGVAYNMTRKPAQVNASAWSFFFISVNAYMIYKLMREAEEITFEADDMKLFREHFEEHGVKRAEFYKVFLHVISSCHCHSISSLSAVTDC